MLEQEYILWKIPAGNHLVSMLVNIGPVDEGLEKLLLLHRVCEAFPQVKDGMPAKLF
jgi:hypothetical protein